MVDAPALGAGLVHQGAGSTPAEGTVWANALVQTCIIDAQKCRVWLLLGKCPYPIFPLRL